MTGDKILYVVFKLLKYVDVEDITGATTQIKINGVEGFIPVYGTEEEAIEEACDGKYQIYAMGIQNNTTWE